MIPVHFQIPMANSRSWRRYLAQRTVELPAVPQEGQTVVITPDGREEEVRNVWWDLEEQCVKVSLGGQHTKSNSVEFDVDGPEGDIRKDLEAAGWHVG